MLWIIRKNVLPDPGTGLPERKAGLFLAAGVDFNSGSHFSKHA
jgi:hypothetical protein